MGDKITQWVCYPKHLEGKEMRSTYNTYIKLLRYKTFPERLSSLVFQRGQAWAEA